MIVYRSLTEFVKRVIEHQEIKEIEVRSSVERKFTEIVKGRMKPKKRREIIE